MFTILASQLAKEVAKKVIIHLVCSYITDEIKKSC